MKQEKILKKEERKKKRKKTWYLISYAFVYLGANLALGAVNGQLTKYYEDYVGLPIGMMTFAIIFYTIWDAFNDPLIGFISDRKYRFTRKWGKRFPWIIFTTIPLVVVNILIFSPPDVEIAGGWVTLVWYLLFLMLFDGCRSAMAVNYHALTPVKFPELKERKNVSFFVMGFGTIGTVVGLILPGIVIGPEANVANSRYILLGVIVSVILVGTQLLSLPGVKESKELKESYFKAEDKEKPRFWSDFIKSIKFAFKQKNFRIFTFQSLCFVIYTLLIISSVPYYVEYVLQEPKTFEIYVFLPYVLSGVILLPIFYLIARKVDHVLLQKIISFIMPVIMIGFVIWPTPNATIIIAACLGATNVFFNFVRSPTQADFLDELAVQGGVRKDGAYMGILNFFNRVGYVFQLLFFWIIHTVTNFDGNPYNPASRFGITTHFAIIPAILLFIGALVFLRFDFNKEKRAQIKAELKDLGQGYPKWKIYAEKRKQKSVEE